MAISRSDLTGGHAASRLAYHVVAKMNEVVDKVRRDEQNRLSDEGKNVLKGSRYLLLYGKEKLDKHPVKKARLDALLEASELLSPEKWAERVALARERAPAFERVHVIIQGGSNARRAIREVF